MELLKKMKLPLYYNGMTITPNSEIPKIVFVRNDKTRIKVKINIKSFLTIMFILFIQHYSLSNNVGKYWNFVHKAENEIVKEKYKEAVQFYDTAFTCLKLPFQKDIHNQIECAKYTHDFGKVKLQVIFLLEKYNLNPKYLRRYKKYYDGNIFKKYVELYTNKSLEKSGFIKSIDSLFILDQKIRTNDNYMNHPQLIKTVDSLSFVFIKNKWLDENNYDKINVNLLFDVPNYEPDSHFYTLIRHWFQQKLSAQEDFLRLVLLGKFPPEVYADLKDVMDGSVLSNSQYGIFTKIKYGHKIKLIKRNTNDIHTIDQNRIEIGLPYYNEYVVNTEFFKKHKHFIYYNLCVLNFTGNKMFESYFNSL